MRLLKQVLLTTCAVCAVAPVVAAQPNPTIPAAQPAPTTTPSPTSTSPDPYTPATTPAAPAGTYVPDPNAPTTTDPNVPPLPPVSAAPVPVDAPVAVAPMASTYQLDDTNELGYAWTDKRVASGIGISTVLGGGVAGFTDKQMRSTTSNIGGLWDLRVSIGSRMPIALDLSYVGSATNINGLAGNRNGTLVGSAAEAGLRWNILPHYAFTPYIFGGAGWQRYDVTQTNVSLSDSGMNQSDNLIDFPAGLGFTWHAYGFVADVRGTYRATIDQNLVLKNPTGLVAPNNSNSYAPMDTWEASAALGYEF